MAAISIKRMERASFFEAVKGLLGVETLAEVNALGPQDVIDRLAVISYAAQTLTIAVLGRDWGDLDTAVRYALPKGVHMPRQDLEAAHTLAHAEPVGHG